MPREAREKSTTGIYHIIWRGANRQEIFHEYEDWVKYLDILKKYQIKNHLTVNAWCLMNNHVHLLIKEGNEEISITMKRIAVSYAGYYNEKYRTTGHLFQDRFRSEVVEDRRYFLTVVRYIHQNPVKAGMVHHAGDWQWSSCQGYYGHELYPKNLLQCDTALALFAGDRVQAREQFKGFNERKNNDICMEAGPHEMRLSDEEAREEIKKTLGAVEMTEVKSLPKEKRQEALRRVKGIKGMSLRQAARILGISLTLVFKA